MNQRDVVMTFHSTHQAILAEKLVAELALNHDLIPTPRVISAGCGLTLELASDEVDRWLPCLRIRQVIWGGIYLRQEQQFVLWNPGEGTASL